MTTVPISSRPQSMCLILLDSGGPDRNTYGTYTARLFSLLSIGYLYGFSLITDALSLCSQRQFKTFLDKEIHTTVPKKSRPAGLISLKDERRNQNSFLRLSLATHLANFLSHFKTTTRQFFGGRNYGKHIHSVD